MEMTLGKRIAALRRQRGMTQEELAEKLGVSAQAVSKWENELSCPDIMLLPALARLLHVTVDALLTGEAIPETQLIPDAHRKPLDQMLLKIFILDNKGDKVRINLPLALVKMGLEMGMSGGSLSVNGSKALEKIDLNQLMALVEKGVLGKLVEIDSGDGDHLEVWVE